MAKGSILFLNRIFRTREKAAVCVGPTHRNSTRHSVVVLRILVLVACIHVVMVLAQRLPITMVAEQVRVATVWTDVVHNSGFSVLALALTGIEERMGVQIGLRQLSSAGAVATIGCGAHLLRVYGYVVLTVFLSLGYQLRTAGMTAGMVRESRHPKYLLCLIAEHVLYLFCVLNFSI